MIQQLEETPPQTDSQEPLLTTDEALRGQVANIEIYLTEQKGYSELKLIGCGGDGLSFEGVNPEGRKVVIKALRDLYDFERADFVSVLEHRSLCRQYKSFASPAWEFFSVRDYAEGQSLEDRIGQEGVLSLNQVLPIMRDLLEVLKYLKEKNLIHRDIKPSNIIISEDKKGLKLIDFDSVKAFKRGSENRTQSVPVSFGYTAPEQYLGNPDFRSDLYSLGVTVIKCLTGKVPDELKEAISGKQYRIPKELAIPKPLRNLLQSMINREVDKRPKSAEAALKELEKIINKYSTNGELNVSLSGARIISTTISAVRNSCRSVAQKVVGSIIEAKDRLINAAKGLFSSSGEVGRGSFVRIGWHRAVRGEISANGQQIDTLLSEGSFNKTLDEQIAYAKKLGYRLATRKEHEAYINSLLEKEA
ncbi:MAG: serine/threonine protein kinase, partial [Pseudomonadota bacterium]